MAKSPAVDNEVSALLAQAAQAWSSGHTETAQALLEKAHARDPKRAEVLVTLGSIRTTTGRAAEALPLLRRAVSLRPDLPVAHGNLGLALSALGQHREALASLTRATRLAPSDAAAFYNLGNGLHAAGDAAAACMAFETAIRLAPAFAEAYFNLGTLRREAGDRAGAEAAWRAALAQRSGHVPSRLNLSALMLGDARYGEALAGFDALAALAPDLAEAHNGRGNALHALERLDEALAAFGQAVALAPQGAEMHYNLANQQLQLGLIPAAIASFERTLALDPRHAQAAQNLLFTLNYSDRHDAEKIAQAHRQWGPGVAAALGSATRAPAGAPAPEAVHAADQLQVNPPAMNDAQAPIRIGFVSRDLRTHSVAFFLLPLLQALDRSRFAVTCYPTGGTADAMTARLQALSSGWRSIEALDDDTAARAIAQDGIDVLIDLAGHSAGQRLGVFARRPARCQMTWLGYPNTTGVPQIDWRIVDLLTDPDDAAARHATEGLLRLPGCFVCYQPPAEAPAVSERVAGSPIVFGSFNALAKISDATVALWAAVLRAVPDAQLALKAAGLEQPGVQQRLRDAFAAHGLDPQRLTFLPRAADVAAHLACYAGVDIALDTFPYHGTTTTCEALWMGVPVVSLVGDRHVSRVGASLLTAAGRASWATDSTQGYVDRAAALAHEVAGHTDARTVLRAAVASSALLDASAFAARFSAAIEQALQQPVRAHTG